MEIAEQAAEYIRSGDMQSAIKILSTILQNDPHNAQAWYLLSFTVDDQKALYSIDQALKYSPGNDLCQKRKKQIMRLPGNRPARPWYFSDNTKWLTAFFFTPFWCAIELMDPEASSVWKAAAFLLAMCYAALVLYIFTAGI